MTQHDDKQIHDLFRAARRADQAHAPGYDAVRRASSSRKRPWARRGFRLAFLGATGSVAIAAAFLWVGTQHTPPTTIAVPHEEPIAAPESGPMDISELGRGQTLGGNSEPPPPTGPKLAGSDEGPGRVRKTGEVAPEPKNEERRVNEPPPPPVLPAPEPRVADQLASLGYVAGESASDDEFRLADPGSTQSRMEFKEVYAKDLTVAGRYYQNVLSLAPGAQDADGDGNPNVHGSRERDFKTMVSGVSNVAPLVGEFSSQVNPNSIEEMEVIPAGAGAEHSRAQGGFAGVVSEKKKPGFDPYLQDEPSNTESYAHLTENEFLAVEDNPLSTFSIDVDTASYSNVRRYLHAGQLPPAGAVRIEELVNYFNYDYPQPEGVAPFSATVEVSDCPWNEEHRLARIGLKGRQMQRGEFAGSNLVFLIDVSGSMQPPNKLPLLRSALKLLVNQLDGRDQVAMVVYAGSSGLVLDSTAGSDGTTIHEAIDRLDAGGSTNGGQGIRLAYEIARENFIPGGVNRVILATDGDFNVGVSSHDELLKLIKQDADNGIFLTVLGFGGGNYKDDTLELLADKGNGNYAYIDNQREAQKVLVEQVGGTLVTIAKDVKIQIEFNPAEVGAYRLIGYENRMLAKEDFNDDKKDAGEIGAGHTVTALYELVPPGKHDVERDVDALKYQQPASHSPAAGSGELFTLKLRYKEPEERTSRLLSFPVKDDGLSLQAASADFKLASSVALFGMLLRRSEHRGSGSFDDVRRLALDGGSRDRHGHRAEFAGLVELAASLSTGE